jgi:hypothetical protein
MTPFIEESISEVFWTLAEAVILVAINVLVFLQNWRSAIIPLIAVPVAIICTFAAMAAIGFSLNTLTLFGLVLAVGIVVDDAIVVVEAIEHHIELGWRDRALIPTCQFLWGAAEASHLLGQPLALQKNCRAANVILRETFDIHQRLGDPKATQTERLLNAMSDGDA